MVCIKLLIGGSPCTHWSIAQTKNRETKAEGIGWELFKNYVIARDKYKPDYFLYENNKSMSKEIREQITTELGVEPVLINSALVSAQNRQRLYWVGKRNDDGTYSQVDIEQPEDRNILLRDVLESGIAWKEKAYTIDSNYWKTLGQQGFGKQSGRRKMVAEPVNPTANGKAHCLTANRGGHNLTHDIEKSKYDYVAEAVYLAPSVGKPLSEAEMEYMVRETKDGRNHFDFEYYHDASKEKSACVTANTHKGAPYNVLVEPIPVNTTADGKAQCLRATCYKDGIRNIVANNVDRKTCVAIPVPSAMRQVGRRINDQGHRDDHNENIEHVQRYEVNDNPQKTNCLTTVQKDNMIAEPVCVAQRGRYTREDGAVEQHFEIQKSNKTNTLTTVQKDNLVIVPVRIGTIENDAKNEDLIVKTPAGKEYTVYEVKDGQITIKGKQYPIKLADGYYIIRKLTVTECKRLQTVPDGYIFPVSDTQAYKMLGNGWTVDVIAHIMSHFDGLTDEPVEVLSMYDGMSCGHIALDKLGVNVERYYATEIDKYAIKTTQKNYPDTVQLGDAFQVREDDWGRQFRQLSSF